MKKVFAELENACEEERTEARAAWKQDRKRWRRFLKRIIKLLSELPVGVVIYLEIPDPNMILSDQRTKCGEPPRFSRPMCVPEGRTGVTPQDFIKSIRRIRDNDSLDRNTCTRDITEVIRAFEEAAKAGAGA